ncbi:xylulokinase [Mitsuokella sp. oral taxon 131]|uniref:xylulokinase n=1 Tax=Mitsuokella sp. oral taxon 131 TaxID=1321780 RepID=UPI0003AE41A5|nr:FGGY family carbohydrate kinase [Mitsuokella sp. oral taxon 131]ERL04677.1 carbohydrate kinase, FGGY family protein [Mitsuokella sp. oral taxon 131 str. W9106]
MKDKDLLLGIDAGSTGTKLSLFTTEGELLRETSFQVVISRPERNEAELDLEDFFGNLTKEIRAIVDGVADRVAGLGFSVANPTVVFFDKDMEAVRPGIAYFDNRSVKEVADFVERFGGANMYFGRVGNNPSPSTCVAATIQWVRTHEPEVWAEVDKVGFLNSYLGAKMTGVLACEPTTASYSGLLRIKKPYAWEHRFTELYDLSDDLLPPLISCMDKLGGLKADVARALGLAEGTPVSLGAADTAASSIAMGVRRHGDVFQSMGTSEVIVFCLNNPNFSPAFMNRGHVIPGLWLSNGAMSMAGGSIRWFLTNIAPDLKNEVEMEALAEQSPRGANGVMYVPYLCGERSPIFDAKALGLFFGITANTTKADLARAVYEGVALAMNQIYQIGKDRWDVDPPYVICIGGATKSKLSLQLRANIQNIPIHTVNVSNAAAFGAAILGGFASGAYKDIWDFPVVENYDQYIEPDPYDAMFYMRYKKIYDALYPALKENMHDSYDYAYSSSIKKREAAL